MPKLDFDIKIEESNVRNALELVDPRTANLPNKTKKELIEFIYNQVEFYNVVSNESLRQGHKIHQLGNTLSQQGQNLRKAKAGLASAKTMLKSVISSW